MINLPENKQLHFERDNKKIRLVLTNGDHELACRKETASKMLSFLTSANEVLFKGRLQLRKNDDDTLTVALKGAVAGTISIAAFKKELG
ncbi:hypothetical protein FFF34_000915 [Inquilinus sp. KBS0705]|nr:hypothetical protein FFF34_000915 [Inquilinus sp. KBS0705]